MSNEVRSPAPGCHHTRTVKRAAHDSRYRARIGQGSVRCVDPKKHPLLFYVRTHPGDVMEKRVAGILRKRKSRLSSRFAAHAQPCVVPVNVSQLQVENIACAQGKAGEKEQDRSVTQSLVYCRIARSDGTLNILQGDVAGQCR